MHSHVFAPVTVSLLLAVLASSSPTSKRDSTTKYVFAHHIVGNTYPYTLDDWTQDITLAFQAGIDAFALNVGPDSWQPDQVANAYTAAEDSGTGFKMFFSIDMTVLSCSSTQDASDLADWINQYSSHSNQFLYPPSDPKLLLSTFSGESCTFGQSSPSAAWSYFKSLLPPTYFVPSFFVDPATFGSSGLADSMDGAFQWNAGWEIDVTTDSLESALENVGSSIEDLPEQDYESAAQGVVEGIVTSVVADYQYIDPLQSLGKTYMTAVSPWFFTHYSPETYNKNWVYISDYLYPLRWQTVVSARDNFDLVEILTWNDYGESSYIGPIHGAQPNSQAWVDGMIHTPWLDLTLYYASAYKSGSYPAITQDALYMWARTHPANATATSDDVGPPSNYETMQDSMFVVCLATEDAVVDISTEGDGSDAQSFDVQGGLTIWAVPLAPGATMWGQMVRYGQTVLTLQNTGFSYVETPSTYNFNAFVASSSS